MFREDKKKIVDALAEVIFLTRYGQEVELIRYEKCGIWGGECVYIIFKNGMVKCQSIEGDSGTAIISDISRCLHSEETYLSDEQIKKIITKR